MDLTHTGKGADGTNRHDSAAHHGPVELKYAKKASGVCAPEACCISPSTPNAPSYKGVFLSSIR